MSEISSDAVSLRNDSVRFFYDGQFNGHHMTDSWHRTQVAVVSLLNKANEDDLLNRARKG
ncbi:hypothetical protein [Microseira wollei]|uniref:hypothetical protein n=1 Tax=Microseira wollei TaxID=467598 RepID=UPI001CFC7090|nr:hypothetical protein [Microseira wollei]